MVQIMSRFVLKRYFEENVLKKRYWMRSSQDGIIGHRAIYEISFLRQPAGPQGNVTEISETHLVNKGNVHLFPLSLMD